MTDGPIAPLAPQGVEVVRADGERVPVELEYRGHSVIDGEMFYRWGIATELEWLPGDTIEIELWPANTALAVPKGWVGTLGAR